MNLKFGIFCCLIVCNLSYGQNSVNHNSTYGIDINNNISSIEYQRLVINSNIVLPEDSLESRALLSAVNSFLISAQQNKPNKWLLDSEIIETQILIDEILNIQESEDFKSNTFFKPYLSNVIPLVENKYLVKISYIGIHADTANLRASFVLIAHKTNDSFLISSPLKLNTQNWNKKNIKNHIG